MNMTKIVLLFALTGALGFGQQTLYSTTTSSAVTISAQSIVVASATNIAARRWIYLQDPGSQRGELMQVDPGYTSGTRVNVIRGVRGAQVAHISGAYVIIATAAEAFVDFDPIGACTRGTTGYTPIINTVNGNKWYCSSIGMWTPWFGTATSQNMQLISATATASAAGAVAIGGPFLKISGTEAITSFTMPAGWTGQGFCAYPTAAWTIVAGNNIAKAATAVADRVLCFAWDAAAGKFTPGY